MRSVAGRLPSGGRRLRHRFELRVRLEDPVAHDVLRRLVDDRPQEREAPALAVHRVRPRRERDVPAVAAATLPDAEADQLQAGERRFAAEVQFGVREFAGGCRDRSG